MEALVAELSRRALVDGRALERARGVAAETGRRLDTVMVQLGIVGERAMAEALATVSGLTLATAADYPALPVLADRLRPGFLRHARALPLRCDDDALVLAVADPLDPFTPAAIAAAAGRTVICMVAVPVELEAALATLFPAEEASAGDDPSPEPIAAEEAERLRDMASEAPVIRIVNQIITRAVEAHASDIHIEPFEDRLRVRYRFDGMLHEAEMPPARLSAAIVSRIKIMARLDIAERRLPQDGRIRLAIRGHDVDFRVATVPSLWGETVVLRVLDRSAVAFDYARLGLAAPVVARLTAALEQPNGVLLVTGPTGSGKTTTLYTALLALNAMTRKIITVEDPIEFHLAGINQIQVRPQIGLNFASLLRSILRLDPDIIMIGEIRDTETGQIAVQAALTGHFVLSTLHTNGAAATITRLRDMGIEDYLLTPLLRGVPAQRLVRRLCTSCRRDSAVPAEIEARYGLAARTPGRTPRLWQAVGCPQCNATGYRGRLAIAEFLVPDAETTRLILARADQGEIEAAAVSAGMRTMFDAGLDAAMAGETTIEEVYRSIRAEP
ncbi:MAG: GspE/PulE family protein [Alphaproteobacteria bacterium]|nr:GspE/PulE family protein [Alphaproteobacteria bacterium]